MKYRQAKKIVKKYRTLTQQFYCMRMGIADQLVGKPFIDEHNYSRAVDIQVRHECRGRDWDRKIAEMANRIREMTSESSNSND